MSRRVRTLTLERRERSVSSVHPVEIWFWSIFAAIFAVNAVIGLLAQDWSRALDGGSLAIITALIASKSRDVNALLGGWR